MPVSRREIIQRMEDIRACISIYEQSDFYILNKLHWLEIGMELLRDHKKVNYSNVRDILGLPQDTQEESK